MNSEDRERQLDHLLHKALASYSQAEPRAGFEERILANLRAQPAKSRWWMWAAIPTAALALLLITATLRVSKPQSVPQAVHVPALVAPAQPETSSPATAKAPPRARPRQQAVASLRRQERAKPHLEVFPSPSLLSEQERLLLRLTAHDPQEAALLALAQQKYQRLAQQFLETGEFPEDVSHNQ